MNTKQLFFVMALCLTTGVRQAPAQGFLNKLKNAGTQIVKKAARDAAPEPVKKVIKETNKTEAKVRGTKNKVQRGESKARTARAQSFDPGKKVITVKFCEGVGQKMWYGRVGGVSPAPPAQCPKQPAWFEALPQLWDLTNERLAQESDMLEAWMKADKPACEPVLVRREFVSGELKDRIEGVNKAVKNIINNDPDEEDFLASSLEDFGFKRAVSSDLKPLYPSLDEDVVAWLKKIDRKTKTLDIKVYAGGSSSEVKMWQDGMWFSVNTQAGTAKLENLDMDQATGRDFVVPATIHYGGRTFKVTEIGASAFNTLKMKSVTLPEGLKEIGDNAFACTNLSAITIPQTVTKIGHRAFASMPLLKTMTVPESVKEMGRGVFSVDKSLTSVTLPSRLNRMNNTMFQLCTALTKVTLPRNITTLPEFTFEDCRSLASVTLPDCVTEIGQNAFKNTALTVAPVPASLKKIGSDAFSGCTKLTTVNIHNGVEIGFMAFRNCKSLKKAKVGKQYKEDWYELVGIFSGCPFMPTSPTSIPAAISFNE